MCCCCWIRADDTDRLVLGQVVVCSTKMDWTSFSKRWVGHDGDEEAIDNLLVDVDIVFAVPQNGSVTPYSEVPRNLKA